MLPDRQTTRPGMDLLTAEQARVVLRRLLTAHPALRQEADLIAVRLLEAVDSDAVADAGVGTSQRLPLTAIAQRTGRQRGGYVHETDAGWELLAHTLQPWRDDLARLAGAGLDKAAQRVVARRRRRASRSHRRGASRVAAGLDGCRRSGGRPRRRCPSPRRRCRHGGWGRWEDAAAPTWYA